MDSSGPLPYVPALDGLRCVAVTLVFIYHLAMPVHIGGNAGVDIFFVLSGYLITSILVTEWENSQTISVKRFYLRRMIRLYPPLLLCTLMTSIAALIIWPDTRGYLAETAAAATYLIPVYHVAVGDEIVWYHTWTLAFEEWFYLAWPLVLIALLRTRLSHRAIGIPMGALGLLMLVGKILLVEVGIEYGSYLRVGGLLVGGAVALYLRDRPLAGSAPYWAPTGFVCIILAVAGGSDIAIEPYTYLMAVVGAAIMVPALLRQSSHWSKALAYPALVWIGKRSYEIYLWHYPVLVLAAKATSSDHNEVWWWAGPLGLLLAFTSYRLTTPLTARWKSKTPYFETTRGPVLT